MVFSDWANAVGWIIAMTAILAVPLVAKAQIIWKVFMVHSSETWPDRYVLSRKEMHLNMGRVHIALAQRRERSWGC